MLGWCVLAEPSFAAADPATPARADAEPEAGSDSPLDFKADTALWTAVVFLVLLLVLWRFAWGPLTAGLDRREKAVADQIAQAEQSNQEAKRLLGKYEEKLAESREEVRGILEAARRDADGLGREMIEKAKEEAHAEQQRAIRQIDAAAANAMKELAGKSAEMAVELAGKILGKQLDADDHTVLIERAVAGLAEKPK